MSHDGTSVSGAEWERLDAPAATPRRLAATRQGEVAPLRLRRSRNQILSALDGGGSLLQRRGRDIAVGSSLLLLPIVALNLWTTSVAFDRTGATTLGAFGGDDVGTGVEEVAAVLVVVFASLAAALVGVFAATILVADRFGHEVGLWSAFATTVRRAPALLVLWATGHFWVPFFATFAISSPSESTAGRLFLVLPVALAFASVTVMAVPVMVAERLGPFRSMRRAWKLARVRFGTACGFVLLSALIGGLLLAGIGFLPRLAETTGFITFGRFAWLAQGIAGQLGVIIVVPLIALATAQLYLEVRLDAEGLDLAIDADAAFGPNRT